MCSTCSSCKDTLPLHQRVEAASHIALVTTAGTHIDGARCLIDRSSAQAGPARVQSGAVSASAGRRNVAAARMSLAGQAAAARAEQARRERLLQLDLEGNADVPASTALGSIPSVSDISEAARPSPVRVGCLTALATQGSDMQSSDVLSASQSAARLAFGDRLACLEHGARCMRQRGMRDTAFERSEADPVLVRTDSAASDADTLGSTNSGHAQACQDKQNLGRSQAAGEVGETLTGQARLKTGDVAALMVDNVLFEPCTSAPGTA